MLREGPLRRKLREWQQRRLETYTQSSPPRELYEQLKAETLKLLRDAVAVTDFILYYRPAKLSEEEERKIKEWRRILGEAHRRIAEL